MAYAAILQSFKKSNEFDKFLFAVFCVPFVAEFNFVICETRFGNES